MLMTVCRRYVVDEASAKDILQESFIKIFTNIDKYKPVGSFEAWMRTITIRSALYWLKKHGKKETEKIETNHQLQTAKPEILDRFDAEEIIELIRELPVGFRTVFNLNIIEGYNHNEIAKMLNITESTSRSQLTRARKLLQEKLKALQS